MVKPNAEELAEAVGRPLATVGDAVKAAEELRAMGARAVLASLGADGQLLVEDTGTWFASARVDVVRSNVGAGDSSLAGFLVAGGSGPAALASAVAHGAAAVQLPGSVMPTPSDLDPAAVTVTARCRWTATRGAGVMTTTHARPRSSADRPVNGEASRRPPPRTVGRAS